MNAPDPNKEVTLTVGEFEVLIQAACSRAVAEHNQLQARAAEVSKKLQGQLAEKQDGPKS